VSRVASELEVHASGVARALEDLSERRDIVRRIESELTEARDDCVKAERIFEERRYAMFEKFPELAPAGHVVNITGQPVPGSLVIEVDDDTPPDPLNRGGDPDADDAVFVEH
jgi:CTP-dependent riboflavin kinase